MDATGGNCRSIVCLKRLSKGKDCIIIQNAKEFVAAAACFVPSTLVFFINESTVTENILEITFLVYWKCMLLSVLKRM